MPSVRINHQIKAPEIRVVGPEGENFGVLSLQEALTKAGEFELDLIEISPTAVPPVAKIMDYGKFQYEANKKERDQRKKAHTVEVKSVQIKIGTSEHDLALKAKKISEWLAEGNRVKITLFLSGRSKYMDIKFLKERIARVLHFISEDYKIAEEPTKTLKGIAMMIERSKGK